MVDGNKKRSSSMLDSKRETAFGQPKWPRETPEISTIALPGSGCLEFGASGAPERGNTMEWLEKILWHSVPK